MHGRLLFFLLALSSVAETRVVRTVTWQWAPDYIDQEVYVTGKVVAGYEMGERCFLRFDNSNKHSFVVIISGEQLKQQPFATPVHAMYVDQPVRVRGVVRANKARNRAEMHVQDLSMIEYGDDVLAQPLPLPDEIPEPEEVEAAAPVATPPELEPEPTPPAVPPLDPGPALLPVPVDTPPPPVEPEAATPAVPPLDPGPALLPMPVDTPPPPVEPVEPEAATPAVPPLDPGPALLPMPVDTPPPPVEPAAIPEPKPIPEPAAEPAAVPEPKPAPEPAAEEVELPVPVAEPIPEVVQQVEATTPTPKPVPEIDSSVVAITLDDAVLDLAPPTPKKPKFRKLDLSEMGAQVIASSTSKAFPGEEEAEIIIDGKPQGSFWSSESSDAQEITVDLKAQFLLRSVALFWESPAAKYHVRTSQDGVIWTTVSEEEGLGKGPRADRVKLSGSAARFLRIQMLERVVATRGYSLFELELIGSPAP